MMNFLLIAIATMLSWGISPETVACTQCGKIDMLKTELDASHKKFIEHLEESKKVKDGPTEEKKALEIASANVYRYVCDFEAKKSSTEDKLSLTKLVLHVYDLNIDDALIADMFSCFNEKYQSQKKAFSQIAQKEKLTSKLDIVLIEGSRR